MTCGKEEKKENILVAITVFLFAHESPKPAYNYIKLITCQTFIRSFPRPSGE